MDALIYATDAVLRETMLFAAIGFVIGGIDDLIVDLVFLIRTASQRLRGMRTPSLDTLVGTRCRQRIAVFVPAWDEAGVIGAMLRTTLARFDHPDWRLYVGAYPNDPGTIAAIAAITNDARLRLVVNDRSGPTTKADCLNTLWRAMQRDGDDERRPFTAVVLHDAEDVVHPGELRLHDHLLQQHDAVQLPVLPLADPDSRLVAGHYLDEFAEAHGKQLPVRKLVGAALPLAGVGCAIATTILARIAEARGGLPFDEASLTEDYELGLTIGAMGGRTAFAQIEDASRGDLVATRAFFPGRLETAVRQKSRWMTGIVLAGWDRTGWHRDGGWGDHWMRMRDRRAVLAVPVLGVAYLALLAWGLSMTLHAIAGYAAPPVGHGMALLLLANAVLLAWRITMRVTMVWRYHGRREALWSVPRLVVSNVVALLAARRALSRYVAMLRGGAVRWDKTPHHFPAAANP